MQLFYNHEHIARLLCPSNAFIASYVRTVEIYAPFARWVWLDIHDYIDIVGAQRRDVPADKCSPANINGKELERWRLHEYSHTELKRGYKCYLRYVKEYQRFAKAHFAQEIWLGLLQRMPTLESIALKSMEMIEGRYPRGAVPLNTLFVSHGNFSEDAFLDDEEAGLLTVIDVAPFLSDVFGVLKGCQLTDFKKLEVSSEFKLRASISDLLEFKPNLSVESFTFAPRWNHFAHGNGPRKDPFNNSVQRFLRHISPQLIELQIDSNFTVAHTSFYPEPLYSFPALRTLTLTFEIINVSPFIHILHSSKNLRILKLDEVCIDGERGDGWKRLFTAIRDHRNKLDFFVTETLTLDPEFEYEVDIATLQLTEPTELDRDNWEKNDDWEEELSHFLVGLTQWSEHLAEKFS